MARPRVKSIFDYKHSLLDNNWAYSLRKKITSGKTSLANFISIRLFNWLIYGEAELKTSVEQDRSYRVQEQIRNMEDVLELLIAVEESNSELKWKAMICSGFIERELDSLQRIDSLKAECQLEFEFMDDFIDGVVSK